jgi:MFS family permease
VSEAATGPRGALESPEFRRYLCARLTATVGAQMQGVAVGWQVYEITGRLMDLGLIGLAQFAPFFVLVLPAGQAADRYERKRTIVACYAVQCVCALTLLGFSVAPRASVWPVFAVLAVQGAARAFIMPAQQAILMNIVPISVFGQAVAVNSSTFHVAVVLGPTLGGLLYAAGPRVVYALVALLLAAALVLMLGVRVMPHERAREPVSLSSLLQGLRFVWAQPIVLGAMSLDLFAVLLGGAVGLLPAYARDVLHTDSAGLGLLRTAPGAGAAVMSMLLAFVPVRRHVGLWMFAGVVIFGVATLVLGFTDDFAVALIALFMTGLGDMLSVYVRHVLVQFGTPDAIRGRVSAVNAVFISASNELGTFESGLTAAWFGVVPAIVLGGGLTLLVALGWMLLFPSLTRLAAFPAARAQREESAGGSA